MDPTIQRATCAAVLDVLDHTRDLTDAQRNRRSRLGMRASEQLFALGNGPGTDARYSQPPTPPSAVDAVLAWCARELDRVGVP
jgi:hypothetical protein